MGRVGFILTFGKPQMLVGNSCHLSPLFVFPKENKLFQNNVRFGLL